MKAILSVIRLVPVLLVAAPAAELPVRDVVLYKNGVAFFQRTGEIKPGETIKLDFKSSEMNDLLKSLTVSDNAGGKVTALRYDSAEPLDRQLAEFPVQIGPNQNLSSFLDRMKGASLTVRYGTESLTGTILSARTVPGGRDQPDHEQLTLILDSGDLRNLELTGIPSLRFNDPAIERQLRAYLRVISNSRAADRRSIYIDATSAAARTVSASYMIPSPIWKSSYRLLLDDKSPMLEGWAIVDNTTADDWANVHLSLVSGRPVSFISRLYEPRYRQRPYGDLAEETSVGPRVYEGGVIGGIIANSPAPPPAPAMLGAVRRDEVMSRDALSKKMEAQEFKRVQQFSSVAVNTAGREVGELFEYGFSTPVTVKRGESAMLPFLQEKITSRKLLIYSDESSVNPMNAAEITNSTGKTLDGGPITVYDGGSYGGEALVETLKAGDKRLISYAVDLGTRVTTRIDSERELVREIHLNRGILTTRAAQQETKVYSVKNVDQKAKTLVIEHPLRDGYKLLNAKPVETTAHAHRFELKLAPGAESKFPVSEEFIFENTLGIQSQSPESLLVLIQNKAISDAGRRALQSIADKKREIAAADSDMNRMSAESQEIERDQNRIRQNISSLSHISGQEAQVQQYSRQLAAGEAKIVTLRDQANDIRKKRQTLQTSLDDMIEKTVF